MIEMALAQKLEFIMGRAPLCEIYVHTCIYIYIYLKKQSL